MPSLNDFYNKITDIDNDLKTVDTDVKKLDTDVKKLDTDVNGGFSQTAAALASLIQLGTYADQALSHISKQDDTIICILEHISSNTCALLTEAHHQTELQGLISQSLSNLTDMFASVHPDAAIDLSRRREMQKRIDSCCPPDQEPPACEYKPCEAPRPLQEFKAPTKIG